MPMQRAPKSSVAPKLQQHAARALAEYISTELCHRSETTGTSLHRFESRSDAACGVSSDLGLQILESVLNVFRERTLAVLLEPGFDGETNDPHRGHRNEP